MAWTSPMTATSGNILTAAQWNTNVRDNLNETAPAKATTSGQFFISTAANSLAARTPQSDYVVTNETSTSTSYTNLSGVGPVVTVTSGTRAIIALHMFLRNNTVGASSHASYEISGATTQAAGDTVGLQNMSALSQLAVRCSAVIHQQAMTSGSNTFTTKYRVDGGTGSWAERRILVIPL